MLYHEILDSLIKDSGLSLKAISKRCEELSVSVSPTYISRLRSGDQAPATLKVNEALARACSADEDLTAIFLWEGYRPDMEKSAPTFVLNYFAKQNEISRDMFRTLIAEDIAEEDRQAEFEQLERSKGQPFIALAMNNTPSSLSEEQKKLVVNIASSISTGSTSPNLPQGYLAKKKRPVMKDDSMTPLIPKGSALSARRHSDAKNGDIVIIKSTLDQHYLIRRWTAIDGKVYLIPENRAYEAVKYDASKHTLLGVVGSVEITLWNSLP